MRYLLIVIVAAFMAISLASCEKSYDFATAPDWNYGSDCHAGYLNHCDVCH